MTTPAATPAAETLSLTTQLHALKQGALQRVGPERVALVEGAIAAIRASGITQRALRAGNQAPDVVLPDALGRPTSLASLWQQQALVVVFYRGDWCPYCNLALRAWQREADTLEQLGATLVAISPLTADNSLTTSQKNELAFPVLSDSSLQAAEAFGIHFTLPDVLVKLYQGMNIDIPAANGTDHWNLPVPATYAIDRSGRIVFAHVEVDWRERADPADVLAVLQQLARVPGAAR